MSLKQTIARHLINIPGWRTNRKIVVIESDDWGSIRMPSREVYEKLLKQGIRVDKCPYNRYDSLASEEDLEALFDVLKMFKDHNGNHPVITANSVVANPDFEKIKASAFHEYHYEPFTETLKRYPGHEKAFNLWQQGMKERVFYPQFHGREHVNIPLWLNLLQQNNSIFQQAFGLGFWGLGREIVNAGKIHIQASFDALDSNEIESHKVAIKEGLDLFEKIFGYKSTSFIANNFIWDSSLNNVLAKSGVATFQGMKYQILPLFNSTTRKMIRHYTGEKNDLGQIYLVRNCVFEPSQNTNTDSVSACLKDIESAFFWKKPAIITSHRLNFIGYIDQKNRERNLQFLEILLKTVLMKWPGVEFITSVNLAETIYRGKDE